MAAADISRTNGTATNNLKWTYSAWLKRGVIGTNQAIATTRTGTSGPYTNIIINNSDRINIYGPNTSSLNDYNYQTTRYFRDVGAWYHLVVAFDCTLAAAGDRLRIYINGVEETSFVTETNPTQNNTYTMNYTGYTFMVGARTDDSEYWTGDMSHVQFVDGLQLTPTEFGEEDATSGIWKIKTTAYATPGTNGFFLKMEDRTNLDLDSSSNAHTFTTTGTLTATYDNPSNNFCTMNPLDNYYLGGTFTNGSNTVATGGGKEWGTATMGLSAGLWYYESEIVVTAANSNRIGIAYGPATSGSMAFGDTVNDYALYSYDGKIYSNSVANTYGDTWSGTGVILGVYIDLNANKLYFAKDGVIMNSGTGFDITAAASTANGFYTPAVADDHSASSATWACNFGNGYFGTTAVTSAVADAGGIGAFEYDPSDGGASSFDGSAKDFRAICTKNIKAYGG